MTRASQVATPLLGMFRACGIHQNAPYQTRGHGQEVCSILPIDALNVDESLVDLIDQGVA